ncbi:hypothetical protein [Aliamphritea spongicola]|nr:hypothetical protein [Aliamphritea spongicola]
MIINHQVGIAGSATDIYEALTTNEGLMDWWTSDVTGAGEVGSVIQFRFNGGGPDFQVTELIPDQRWSGGIMAICRKPGSAQKSASI